MSVFKSKKKLMWLIGVVLVLLAGAYVAYRKMSQPKSVVLNVVFYSYINRATFDVILNDRNEVGGGAPYIDGKGTVMFVEIPFGPQTLTWRDAGTGETFTAKNKLEITREQIPEWATDMAIHIYPDSTAEFTFDKGIPRATPRGQAIYEEAKRKGEIKNES
jgi:hypothetical protein